jgi:hypothetical protein
MQGGSVVAMGDRHFASVLCQRSMKIRFDPPQMAAALQAEVLSRLIEEMKPRGMFGEIAVTKHRGTGDSRLSLSVSAPDMHQVSVSLDQHLLYTAATQSLLRHHVQELFSRCRSQGDVERSGLRIPAAPGALLQGGLVPPAG